MTRPHPIFTPSAVAPARLEAITVGRKPLLDRLTERLIMSATSLSRPHTLVIGPRGSGKTHLLHIVVRRALDDGARGRLLPLWVPEDSLAIGSYSDLLLELIRSAPAADIALAKELRRSKDSHALEQILMNAAEGRVVVVVIENLDKVFESITETGQAALRGFIESAGCFLILASAPLLFSGVSSRDQSWYGSFDVEHLSDLTVEDGQELMMRAALESGDTDLAAYLGTVDGLTRLEAVRELAGGSPRLWHILSGCVTAQSLDELVPAVEALLDRLAPYYQQRLWELPAGEQRLVIELARGFGARTVSDLADSTGVSNQAAATSLGRLAKSRWVNSMKAPTGDQRAAWYELSEPLLRHHLQYREEHGGPLSLIVEFLRLFYSEQQRTSQILETRPGSEAERHLLQSLTRSPEQAFLATTDSALALLVASRYWISGEPAERSPSPELGVAIEAVVLAAIGAQNSRTDIPNRIATIVANIPTLDDFSDAYSRLRTGMRQLQQLDWASADDDALFVLEASWRESPLTYKDFRRLSSLAATVGRSSSGLDLIVRQTYASEIGHHRGDVEQGMLLLEQLDRDIPATASWTNAARVSTCWIWISLVAHSLNHIRSYGWRIEKDELPFNIATLVSALDMELENSRTFVLEGVFRTISERRRRELTIALILSPSSESSDAIELVYHAAIEAGLDQNSKRWIRTIVDAIDGDDSMLLRIPIEMQSKISEIRRKRNSPREVL